MKLHIEAKKLSKVYKIEDQNFVALSDVDLSIQRGEFVIILGQSGCGKSTLLNILGGMDVATSGSVTVGSHILAKKNPDKLARYRREEVGMIFQKFHLINDASVLENVKLPLKFSGHNDKMQTKIAMEALHAVDLSKKAKSLPKKLSGGQQQRVAIARALVNDPKILLCDEPTGNLDSKTGEDILKLLQKLNQEGRTIVMVTHNESYSSYANTVIKMLDGKIISESKTGKQPETEIEPSKTSLKNINLASIFTLALKNLKRRKLRFFLTSFGIAIGAMAIVILVSFGSGLQREVNSQMESISQAEEISVTSEKMDFSFSMQPSFKQEKKKLLNDATIAELEKIPNAETVIPEISFYGEMSYQDKVSSLSGNGSTLVKYIKQTTKDEVKYGQYFSTDDENSVVIPYGQATALGFDNPQDAVGKEVNIRPVDSELVFKAKIAGVIGKDAKFSFQTIIPEKTALNWYKQLKAPEFQKSDSSPYDSIKVRVTDVSKVSEVKQAIDDKGYGTTSYEDIAKQINKTFNIMKLTLGMLGGIALLVASLGIINTMIMSVLERTKEIGVMKAVGARNKDINAIFLSEALSIGAFGGVVGLILGYAGSQIAQAVANSLLASQSGGGDSGLAFYVSSSLGIGVVIFCIVISAIAGFLPARRASRLDPAEALREE